ncbi:helix-turn-helix domain-containing protein [Vibrio owensii]|uniref:helix-turn-helix domain-containing protein n=1 Tax=Vibrio harveyi group TaxID=717610 RepID=UPI003CC59A18
MNTPTTTVTDQIASQLEEKTEISDVIEVTENVVESNVVEVDQQELDRRAAQNLYDIWKAYKREHRVTQEEFATNRLGWSQGNFSQYLNGKTPIGRKSLIKLCEALGCQPGDIREEFRDMDSLYAKEAVTTLLSIVSKFNMSEEDEKAVQEIRQNVA